MRLFDVNDCEVQSGYPDYDLTDAKGQLCGPSKRATHTPKYAILSHRWRQGEEITLRDMQTLPKAQLQTLPKAQLQNLPSRNPVSIVTGSIKRKPQCNISSIYKVVGARQKVLENGDEAMRHIWMDTICINQDDPQEVSRSINSMFRWYRDAEVYYVYLFDVCWDSTDLLNSKDQFSNSDWFKRGWTLQELLAPKSVKFFDRDWKYIGSKDDLRQQTIGATRISEEHLCGSFQSASLAQKMSWLAGRETEQLEDMAYCVLSIFGIHLDTRYGNGEDEFVRLQEEIIKRWPKDVPLDESLLAWRAEGIETSGILAPAPGCFRNAGGIIFLEELAKFRGDERRMIGKHYWSTGIEIDNAGQMTMMVPHLGFVPAGPAGVMLTLGALPAIGTGSAVVYQKRRRHREVQLNCWTHGADGKLHAKVVKMEYNEKEKT